MLTGKTGPELREGSGLSSSSGSRSGFFFFAETISFPSVSSLLLLVLLAALGPAGVTNSSSSSSMGCSRVADGLSLGRGDLVRSLGGGPDDLGAEDDGISMSPCIHSG